MLKVNEKEKMLHKCIHNCWGTSGEYLGNPNILKYKNCKNICYFWFLKIKKASN